MEDWLPEHDEPQNENRSYQHIMYRIRFTKDFRTYKQGQYYYSIGDTSEWSHLASVKGIITRGIPTGYRGQVRIPFEHYEIVKITRQITETEQITDI